METDGFAMEQFQSIMARHELKRTYSSSNVEGKSSTNTIDKVDTTQEGHKRVRPRLKNFVCTFPNCGKAFMDNAHLRDHLLVHSKRKDLKCPQCDKKYARQSALNTHFNKYHVDIPNDVVEPTRRNRSLTINPACGNCVLLLTKCQEQERLINELQAKIIALESKKTPAVRKKDSTALPTVVPIHFLVDATPFHCQIESCSASFSTYAQLCYHARQHPKFIVDNIIGKQVPLPRGPKHCPVLTCEYSIGNRTLQTLQIAKRHYQRHHTDERPFVCQPCATINITKTFKTKDNLTAHLKSH